MTQLAALTAKGDGNCLYNSFSLLLCGNESKHVELRYRWVLELVEQRERTFRSRLYKTLEPLCNEYDNACLNGPKLGTWSSMWNIYALSNALKTKVNVVYPAVNGSQNYTFKTMNTTFRPTFVDPDRPAMTVMWTSNKAPTKRPRFGSTPRRDIWQPDHFVPLVRMKVIEKDELPPFESLQENTLNNDEWPSLIETLTSPQSAEKNEEKFLPDLSTIPEEYSVSKVGYRTSPGVTQHADNSDIDKEEVGKCPVREEDKIASVDELHHYDISGNNYNDEETNNEDEGIPDFQPGPLRTFMNTEQIVNIYRGPYTVLEEIPIGRKDGMYFVIDNTVNTSKRTRGERTEVWDDCGAWQRPACPNQLFIKRDGKLMTVYIKNGAYCVEKNVKKKKVFVPVEPQPKPEDILKVQRHYNTLKFSNTEAPFKRRITWFSNIPEEFNYIDENIAIVEYVGKYTGPQMHGNTKFKERNNVYIKTKPKVAETLKKKLAYGTVKQVEKDMNKQTDDDFEKQRDDKQLRNFRYNLSKLNKPNANAADQELALLDMTRDHEFVQNVQFMKGVKNTVVTLYDQHQLNDIKRFCCKEGGTVLNMDKTYNLGDFFVTPTVYKDMSVIRRSTMDHPICFGPTFLHTSSTTKAYNAFLHQIADELTNTEKKKLIIGSDEEGAFMASIENCLPNATHVLCTRHLRNNSLKYMEDKVGYPLKERQNIVNLIFNKDGLVDSHDDDTFSCRLENIIQIVTKLDTGKEKTYKKYLTDKLVPLIKQHVVIPFRQNKVPHNWTSNNAESANHVLKSATQWKMSSMPEFVETWKDIVVSERKERERAIRNMGNYKLAVTHAHHDVCISSWSSLTHEQQEAKLKKLRIDPGKTTNTVTSTNGIRTVIKTPTAGKKPHQNKRKRAERSRTPSAKPRLTHDS